jgi:uncharacterized membrane protein HdeD (DUF308 family)
MTVRNHGRKHNQEVNHGVSGWKMVVALVILAATAIVVLWMTGSVQATVVIVGLLLLPLGIFVVLAEHARHRLKQWRRGRAILITLRIARSDDGDDSTHPDAGA